MKSVHKRSIGLLAIVDPSMDLDQYMDLTLFYQISDILECSSKTTLILILIYPSLLDDPVWCGQFQYLGPKLNC